MTTTTVAPNVVPPALPLADSVSVRAVAALVLGVLGIFGFTLFAPLAWYFGWAEVRDIRAGLVPASNESLASVGMVLGIIGSAMIAFVLAILLTIGLVA